MLRNYFKVALRNLFKNRLYALINLSGLTIGMTSFILIALYIQFELSYDSHHEKADRTYRVAQWQDGNVVEGSDRFSITPLPLGMGIREEIPEVEVVTNLSLRQATLQHQDEVFNEEVLYADEYLFDVFTIPVVEGVGKEALKNPNNVILTESLARKYFGNESPIGQTILFRNERPVTVRGVIEDVPRNQHFTYDFITSIKNYGIYEQNLSSWNSNNYRTYVVLPEGFSPEELESKFTIFDDRVAAAYENMYFVPVPPQYFLQPLKSIHLRSAISFEMGQNSDIRYVYFFASIAFIILLLAAINYMNLATARSALRGKEVGMRKVLGARRTQLIYQLLGESFLLTMISFVMALALVNLLMPFYNQLLGLEIPFVVAGNQWLLTGMLLTALLIGGLSGLYPALFLSATKPVKALQGNFLKNYKKGVSLRNAMVIGQFVAAIVLAISSIVISQQLRYIQNKKLGYNREQIVYLPHRGFEKQTTLRNELLRHSGVEDISFAASMPFNITSDGVVNTWEGKDQDGFIQIHRNYVDENFIDLFDIELVEGRNFRAEATNDSIVRYILNESAVSALGWESAVGKKFDRGQVIGVVKDFHFQSFDFKIGPMLMAYRKDHDWGHLAIKVRATEMDQSLTHIQQTFKALAPKLPFDLRFMDQAYSQMYESEKRFGQAFNLFTALALCIACMGLFGLVSHNVLRRTKEIGIRKVLGASAANIVELLSRDFLRLVVFSSLVAIPIAWYAMRSWLQNFEYRIEIRWWIFVLTGTLVLLISFLTVSLQSIRAALMNPVDSLRSE